MHTASTGVPPAQLQMWLWLHQHTEEKSLQKTATMFPVTISSCRKRDWRNLTGRLKAGMLIDIARAAKALSKTPKRFL